jgi:hypothetical protein
MTVGRRAGTNAIPADRAHNGMTSQGPPANPDRPIVADTVVEAAAGARPGSARPGRRLLPQDARVGERLPPTRWGYATAAVVERYGRPHVLPRSPIGAADSGALAAVSNRDLGDHRRNLPWPGG